MLDSYTEHYINQSYEDHLDQAWEEYDEEREDYDPYAEAEAMWELRGEM